MSRTDPDAGYMYRDQKPEGFFWLAHRTVDAKHNFIVDVHVTPGNVSDSTVYLARRRFGGKKGMYRRTSFNYVSEEDVYVCPAKLRLTYRTTDRQTRLSPLRLRPQTVERSFADAKELHGIRFTFYRGTEKVQRANLVAAIAQNMKKLANLFAEKDRLHSISSILSRAERLELVEHKKRRIKSQGAI